MLVGLPGRAPGKPLHADAVHGTLVIAISGPGVEAVPMACRGMRCISPASRVVVRWAAAAAAAGWGCAICCWAGCPPLSLASFLRLWVFAPLRCPASRHPSLPHLLPSPFNGAALHGVPGEQPPAVV